MRALKSGHGDRRGNLCRESPALRKESRMPGDVRIIARKESILENSDADAKRLRELTGSLRCGVMEADIDSDVDARTCWIRDIPPGPCSLQNRESCLRDP